MHLDDLDASLLRLLREDARRSYRSLAKDAGTTTPTVSTRIKRLEELGVLRGYRADVDPRFLRGTLYVVRVRARPESAKEVARRLADLAEDCLLLAGGVVQARIQAEDPQADLRRLHDALTHGVMDYEVTPVLDVLSAGGAPALRLGLTCHHCDKAIQGAPVQARVGERLHVFCCPLCRDAFQERYERLQT